MKQILIIIFIYILGVSSLYAKSKGRSYRGGGRQTINKPLEVKGQTRNLSMILTLKNKKDKINFIKLREKYELEIKATPY